MYLSSIYLYNWFVFINGLLFCLLSRKLICIAHFPFLPLSVNWSLWKGSCEGAYFKHGQDFAPREWNAPIRWWRIKLPTAMWKNLARHNKLENLHSNDEWTVAKDREELPYVYQLLILSAPISRKGKTKIKDRWRPTFWIFNHVLHLQFLVQLAAIFAIWCLSMHHLIGPFRSRGTLSYPLFGWSNRLTSISAARPALPRIFLHANIYDIYLFFLNSSHTTITLKYDWAEWRICDK